MMIIKMVYRKVRGALLRAYQKLMVAVGETISRLFYRLFNTRPGLKRGVLVLLLFAVCAVPVALMLGHNVLVSAVWALMLLMLFLGMGAERAAVEWSPVFALPPLNAFAFWRWHPLEKKRFLAVLAALVLGMGCTAIFGLLA